MLLFACSFFLKAEGKRILRESKQWGQKTETDKKYSTNNEILLTIGISFHQIAALQVKENNIFFFFHLIFDDSLMFLNVTQRLRLAIKTFERLLCKFWGIEY
jgi:IS4 transposase